MLIVVYLMKPTCQNWLKIKYFVAKIVQFKLFSTKLYFLTVNDYFDINTKIEFTFQSSWAKYSCFTIVCI